VKRPLVYENAGQLGWNDSEAGLAYMKKAVELDPDLKDGNYYYCVTNKTI